MNDLVINMDSSFANKVVVYDCIGNRVDYCKQVVLKHDRIVATICLVDIRVSKDEFAEVEVELFGGNVVIDYE